MLDRILLKDIEVFPKLVKKFQEIQKEMFGDAAVLVDPTIPRTNNKAGGVGAQSGGPTSTLLEDVDGEEKEAGKSGEKGGDYSKDPAGALDVDDMIARQQEQIRSESADLARKMADEARAMYKKIHKYTAFADESLEFREFFLKKVSELNA